MTAGAMVLKLRRTFMGGPHTAWYREVVRRSIVGAAPLDQLHDVRIAEVHLLTSADDWMNACWAIRSFYQASGKLYALCIHEDGTLPASAREELRRQFPGVRLIERTQADAEMERSLAKFPLCRAFRSTNNLALKVFDLAYYAGSPRLLLLDSDVLFFARPDELLARVEDLTHVRNCANGDVATAYTVTPEIVRERCGFTPIERFNSGLCLIQRDSLQLEWFEEFLGLPGILSHPWRIEQTLLALASSRFGADLLPDAYSVRLESGIGNRPCKHYVGAIRGHFYREGIATLSKRGLLDAKRSVARGVLSHVAGEVKR